MSTKAKQKHRGQVNPSETQLPKKATIKFDKPQFYNDQNIPLFDANKEYEIEGAEWIQRWVKRGGKIIDSDVGTFGENDAANPSTLVPNASEEGQREQDRKNAIGTADLDSKSELQRQETGADEQDGELPETDKPTDPDPITGQDFEGQDESADEESDAEALSEDDEDSEEGVDEDSEEGVDEDGKKSKKSKKHKKH